jgi:phosphatidylglycerophosphate synthase
MSILSSVRDSYRRSVKPKDIFWNRYVARPLAAVLLPLLERSPVTPNQVTFLSLFTFVGAAALLLLVPGHAGLLAAVAVIQLSYVLDCTDGQLARLRGTSTPVGAHLDFLMDELKAFLLVAATGLRLWREAGDVRFLVEALVGLVAIASAISLTTFMRRPEYAAATGAKVSQGSGDYGAGFAPDEPAAAARPASPLRRLLGLVEAAGKLVVHYPSYLVYIAIADRLDLFLHAYLLVNAAYVGRSLLAITVKLGRFSR